MQEKKGWCKMKAVSREQAMAVVSALMCNIDWDQLDGDALQVDVVTNAIEAGAQATRFLKNGAKAVITVFASFVLKLAEMFNPAEFIRDGWSVWKGPANGNGLTGDEDRDIREDALAEIDWSQAEFETCLKKGKSCITGEEKLCRLKKSGKIRYGGRAFLALWQDYLANKEASVLENLYKTKGVAYMDFFGLILRANGRRHVLCLYRYDDGRWTWHCYWLGRVWKVRYLSAVYGQVSSN